MPPAPTITPAQVEEIIERILDEHQHDAALGTYSPCAISGSSSTTTNSDSISKLTKNKKPAFSDQGGFLRSR